MSGETAYLPTFLNVGRSPNLRTSVSSAQVPGVTLVSVTSCTSINAFTGNQLCQLTKPTLNSAQDWPCHRSVMDGGGTEGGIPAHC